MFEAGRYDVAVIGAGHAGIEAALAAARLGGSAVCFATHLDTVGNMPCNPSVGGTAKGHLVREIDALGGEMGRAADACAIQYRMLNAGKGPAVRSLRAQADRAAYRTYMKGALERQERLSLRQAEIVDILFENGRLSGVLTEHGAFYRCAAAVVATGTFLRGRIITGPSVRDGGPDGLRGADRLAEALAALGLSLRRFKTGTPPRILGRTMDTSRMTPEPGEQTIPFSFETAGPVRNAVCCWQTWTTPETHRILRENLGRSPLYSGVIEGVGPRYCPSIEDKVVRFADRDRHPVYAEPMGLSTDEYYLQGLSSSMPLDVQMAVLRSVPGLERAEMTRPGYAIEYDCCDPLRLTHALAVMDLPGLFAAGQFCGSSGYEEAAAQGLVAGINAALHAGGRESFTLDRSTSYIGTLIDDLVTCGASEPYRMMTSRSEYRLLLRQDNADWRLTPLGYRLGLIPRQRYERTEAKYAAVDAEIARLKDRVLPPSPETLAMLEAAGSPPIATGARMADLLRRPEVSMETLSAVDPAIGALPPDVREQVEILVKYEGYLRRQEGDVADFRRAEGRKIPPGLDYGEVAGLRTEARQKLAGIRPESVGQAGRISGVSPADIMALLLHLKKGGSA